MVKCTHCESSNTKGYYTHGGSSGRSRCRDCGKQFTIAPIKPWGMTKTLSTIVCPNCGRLKERAKFFGGLNLCDTCYRKERRSRGLS